MIGACLTRRAAARALCLAALMLGLAPLAPLAAWAQEPAAAEVDTLRLDRADTTARLVVYETERTAVEKVLAFPSSLLHWATRPVGDAVIWAERNEVAARVEDLLWNEARTFGVFPEARLGGPTFAAVGLTARHTRLFGTPRRAEASFLFSNAENLRATLSLANPAPFGPASFAAFDAAYRTDADENLFLTRRLGRRGGETSYRIEQADVRLGVGAEPHAPAGATGLGWSLSARYEWNEIGPGEDDEDEGNEGDEIPFPAGLPGAGTAQLFTAGAALLAERVRGGREGQPRTLAGGRLFAAYGLTGSLGSARFGYHRLLGEWQQFVPLPALGPYRRLVFRSRVEKLFPLPGRAVPFYKLSTLGNAEALRGFEQDRFRGEGSVLLTLEYRYPVWTTWDALVFVDGGQAFTSFAEVAPQDLNWSAGVGLRIYAGAGVSLRLDVGLGGDDVRAFSEAAPGFVQSTRRR